MTPDQTIPITANWLLGETRRGCASAAFLLLDNAFEAVRDSSMAPEVRDYITDFLDRLLDLSDSDNFSRREAAPALSELHFPRRDLRETDLPARARAALRSDVTLGAVGEYLGDFFDQAIARHRLAGSGARALEPALELLYPFNERGRPGHAGDVQDMLAARIFLLVISRMCDVRGRRLSVSSAIKLLADIPFPEADTTPGEERPADWPDDLLWPMEDPLRAAAAAAYPASAYRQAWETITLPPLMLESSGKQGQSDDLTFDISRFPESVIAAIKSPGEYVLQRQYSRRRQVATLQINRKPLCS